LISFIDAEGNATSYQFDSNYLYLAGITNALNQTLEIAYDPNTGFITSITDLRGNQVAYEYDILGRVTKKIYPDLTELEAIYDDQNNCVTIFDELDHKTMKYFDCLGRLVRTERYYSPAESLTETYTYNYLNKVMTYTNSGGHTYSYEYDSNGRATGITNPDSTHKELLYDDSLNVVSFIDENGHKKEYHRDRAGNLSWVKEYTDALNYYLTTYIYDDMGKMTSFTNANGETTYYKYDSLFGITQVLHPDSTAEMYSYDSMGNLLHKTDAHGTASFIYNAVYQLIGIDYPDQSSVVFEYDANGNRTLMMDSAYTASYAYDSKNRVISETNIIEGESYTVDYTYDATFQVTSATYPDGTTINYEYDSLSRLTTIPGYASFSYDSNSHLETMTYGNGIVTTYQYDDCSRKSGIHAQRNGVDIMLFGYEYDSAGNLLQIDYDRMLPDQQWRESLATYQYDWLDRLVAANGEYGTISYSYDPVGNRISTNELTYSYNTANELISMSDGSAFTYDENGNMLTRTKGTDTWSYTYNAQDMLTEAEKNQQVLAQYGYNGDGRRVKKTEWVESLQEYQTVIYIYSGTDVLCEKNLNTGAHCSYIYGPDGRIAKNVDGLIDYYHHDSLGSTRLITDESGNVVTEIEYSPFGECVLTGEDEGNLYTGKERDAIGLYYETGGEIRSAPAVVDGKVLISSTDGKLYCFGIDPDTYLSKAQEYLEEGEIDKAKQFLVKAKEYAETEEEITDIESLLTIVDEKMPEYKIRVEKIKEAESLMNEADRIMWDKKFKKAHDLYSEAYVTFQEVDDEFGEAFCMERMEYITQRLPEETTGISYWLGILALCGVAACLVIWRRRKRQD
jgi:YD repeat-containing protein